MFKVKVRSVFGGGGRGWLMPHVIIVMFSHSSSCRDSTNQLRQRVPLAYCHGGWEPEGAGVHSAHDNSDIYSRILQHDVLHHN